VDPARAAAFGLAIAATGLVAVLTYGALVALAPQPSARSRSGRRAFIRAIDGVLRVRAPHGSPVTDVTPVLRPLGPLKAAIAEMGKRLGG
jgi:hypothetical protein